MVLLEDEQNSGVVDVKNRWYDAYLEKMPLLKDKVAVVTGANSGIGFWAANALAYRGCTVVMACRSVDKGEKAKESIVARFPSAKVSVMRLDNMNFSSVRAFAKDFRTKFDRLDYLINNAGIMTRPHTLSQDGWDCQFQTNHLAHFLLTKELWDVMLKTPGQSRIVHHSSAFHFLGGIKFDRNRLELPTFSVGFLFIQWFFMRIVFPISGLHNMDQWLRYFMSKLAGVLFMRQLAKKIEQHQGGALQDKIITTACHPGYVSTKLLAKSAGNWIGWKLWCYMVAQSAGDGSLPLLEATIGETTKNGDFWGPWYFAVGPPVRSFVRGNGRSDEQAQDLWAFSEECIGEEFVL